MNGRRLALTMRSVIVAIGLVALAGCTMFIRWHAAYDGGMLDSEALSLSFGDVAVKCEFGLWNGWERPTAHVAIKNFSEETITYDFAGAQIVSGDLHSGRLSTPDERGSIQPGKKTKLEIEFEKMIGVHLMVPVEDHESLRWNSSPVTVRLGTIHLGDSVLVVPDLAFSDRRERKFP